MKILHCCLAAIYVDGYGYQENILPKEHKASGHEVRILASTETFVDNNSLGYVQPRSYVTEDGIPIKRIPYSKILPQSVMKKIRLYKGINDELEDFKPEIIFLHNLQFLDIRCFVNYVKKYPSTKIYIDSHTDSLNSGKNIFSKLILHKFLYRYCAKIIEPYTNKFWGVLPARVDYMISMYNIPKNKTGLLVMGAEDQKVNEAIQGKSRDRIRTTFGVLEDDFLIVTGGKIDENKPQILLLMKAINSLKTKKVKLLIFGSVNKKYKEEFDSLLSNNVRYAGWIDYNEVYDYFNSSELVVFPGLHSVLWEQSIGTGKPAIFKYIKGFEHVDVGGNCRFLYEDTEEEIIRVISDIVNNKEIYLKMQEVAVGIGMEVFSYKKIASRSIEN